MAKVSFVARVYVLLAREPLKYHHFAKPLLQRLRRRTAPTRPGGHIAVNYANTRNLRAFTDRNIRVQAHSRTQHNKVLKR
jgi:phosphatidylserine decarboxylase